jgi:glucan 1,3-beta-glucosidase
VLGLADRRPSGLVARFSGLALLATTVLAIQTALGLVFDPRYRDFTDAQLSSAIAPFAITMMLGVGVSGAGLSKTGLPGAHLPGSGLSGACRAGTRGLAETVAALTLAGSAVYIVLNEGFANWQALWFGALLAVLAVTLYRQQDGRST